MNTLAQTNIAMHRPTPANPMVWQLRGDHRYGNGVLDGVLVNKNGEGSIYPFQQMGVTVRTDPDWPVCTKLTTAYPTYGAGDTPGDMPYPVMTMDFWYKTNKANPGVMHLRFANYANWNEEFQESYDCYFELVISDNDIAVYVRHDDSGDTYFGEFNTSFYVPLAVNRSINDGQWHHICMTDKGDTNWYFYVDGWHMGGVGVGGSPHQFYPKYGPNIIHSIDSNGTDSFSYRPAMDYGECYIANLAMWANWPFNDGLNSFTPPPKGIYYPRPRLNTIWSW